MKPGVVVIDLNGWDIPGLVESLRMDDRIGPNYIADLIEEQTRPPKPEEPTGLTARVRDAKGNEWWRWSCDAHTSEPWARVGAVHLDMSDMQTARWSDIAAVEILSAGWSA